jgi:magnesium transporter
MYNIYRKRRQAQAAISGEAQLNISNLRRNVNWSDRRGDNNNQQRRPEASTARTSSHPADLQERLTEILVLELRKDGGRKYITVTGRSLYRYVLQAIAHGDDENNKEDEASSEDEKGGGKGISKKSVRHLPVQEDVPTMPRPDLMSEAVPHEVRETEIATPTSTTTPETGGASGATVDDSTNVYQGESDNKGDKEVSFVELVKQRPPKVSRFKSASEPINVLAEEQQHQQKPRKQLITYRERLGGHIHPRDMRRLFTPFSASNEPSLIVRRHVMLLNFDPLRAIILRDRLIVLVPDGADSMLVYLEERAQGGQVAMERTFFGPSTPGDTPTPSVHDSIHRDAAVSTSAHGDNNNILSKKSGLFGRISMLVGSHHNSNINSNKDPGVVNSRGSAHNSSDVSLMDENDDSDEENGRDQAAAEWAELEGKEWSELPFELSCADAVLHTVTNFLKEDTFELQEAARDYIQRILKNNNGMSDDPLTIIRLLKDSLREMTSRVNRFVQSLNRILDEDEDMALMNLSHLLTHPERFIQPVSPEILETESDEPEIILESHLQQALSLINALDLIQGQVDTAAELIDQKLDATRNKILLANMLISTISLCLSVGMLVGGFFGMNLKNHIENDPDAFAQITFGTIASITCLFAFILSILYSSGTIAPSASV